MKRLFAALSAFLLIASLASCGGGDQPASSAATSSVAAASSEAEDTSSAAEESKDVSSKAASSAAASKAASKVTSSKAPAETTSSKQEGSTKKYASMKAYVESAEAQAELDATKEAVKAMGMDIKLTAEGDKMVYTYTYLQQMQFDETTKATLKEALNAQADTFKALANMIKTVVNVDSPSIVVRYLNADGTEITAQEFKAD